MLVVGSPHRHRSHIDSEAHRLSSKTTTPPNLNRSANQKLSRKVMCHKGNFELSLAARRIISVCVNNSFDHRVRFHFSADFGADDISRSQKNLPSFKAHYIHAISMSDRLSIRDTLVSSIFLPSDRCLSRALTSGAEGQSNCR